MKKHILIIAYGIVISIFTVLSPSFGVAIPDMEYRMKVFPWITALITLSVYLDIFLLYLLFMIFCGKCVKIKEIFNEFSERYVVSSTLCYFIFILLDIMSDNKIVLKIPDVFLGAAMCYFANNYIKKFDLGSIKKYTIFIIILAWVILI